MSSLIKLDKNRLAIFHEGRKKRVFVGELFYDKTNQHYELCYDPGYTQLSNAIALGPELSLFQQRHHSDKLFASFVDRLPVKNNPAYEDYCRTQGVSIEEDNPIILLQTIGKRGPSSFIFEPIYQHTFNKEHLLAMRAALQISQHDVAEALDINKQTIQRIETGKSHDHNTLKRLELFFEFPDIALWQLKLTGCRVHSSALAKLAGYFHHLLEQTP